MEPNCDSKSRRKCVSEKKYKFVRAIVAALCVMMLALTVVPSVTTYAVEDVDDSYDIEAAANTLGTIMSVGSIPIKDEVDGEVKYTTTGVSVLRKMKPTDVGNAGMVLSYTSRPTSLGQWLASQVSASSMRYDYESLRNIYDGESSEKTNIVYQYALYGRALSLLGFDKTGTAAETNMGSMFRTCGGILSMTAYVVAKAVNGLFNFFLAFLQVLNPFSWLENVAKDASADLGQQYSATYQSVGEVGDVFGIDTILQYIAAIYVTCCNLSWALIIPLSVGMYLANMFLFRKTSGGKRLMKRILFIAIGVPLIGGTYTSFLNGMRDIVSGGTSYADTIIASTYIDFENWAARTHLAIPEDKKISVQTPVKWAGSNEGEDEHASSVHLGGALTTPTELDIKGLCSAINSMTTGFTFSSTTDMMDGWTYGTIEQTTFDSDDKVTKKSDKKDDKKDYYDPNSKLYDSDKSVSASAGNQTAWVLDMLKRFTFGDVYAAEQYASSIQSRMSALSSNKTTAKNIYNMMLATSRYKNIPPFNEKDLWGKISSLFTTDSNVVTWNETFTNAQNNPSIGAADENIFGYVSLFDDGGLEVTEGYSYLHYTSNEVDTPYAKIITKNNATKWNTDNTSQRMGLSTMSMYCYLNNDFTGTGVITYGGGLAITNGLTKANHYSVNLIGTGFMPFLYWLESMVLLICISVVGILYSIGMFMGTVKYTFKVIGAMPMAMLGSMRYIAKFVGMVAAMIVNVLVTALMYGIVIEVIIAIANVLTSNPLLLSLASGFGALGIALFSTLIVVVVVVWLTGIILRIRKNAVNSVTEWITQIVGKFFEADGHADPSKPGANIGSKIAGGLATGAGMAAGAKMAGKAGGFLSGALAGDAADGGGEGGGGNDSEGGGIEKEVSQDHFGTDTASDSQSLGGESTSESKTKDAIVDKENNNVDLEKSEATNREAQNSEQALIATSNSTHDAKASQSAEHEKQQSDSAMHSAEESISATHASDEKSDMKEAKAEVDTEKDKVDKTHDSIAQVSESAAVKEAKDEVATEKDRTDKTHDSIAQVSESAAVKEAISKDTTGTADVLKQNVDAINNGGQNLKDAGKALAEGDIDGAKNNVKEAGKNVAGAVVADAVVATTGNTQAASAAGHLTDDAAKGNLDAGSVLRATSALSGGATNGVAGQMPGGANGGAKQLDGGGTAEAPKKSLTNNDSANNDSGQKVSTTNNSQGGSNGQKQSSSVDGERSISHTGSLKVGGMTVNSNNTQNVQQGGPSMNMTNFADNNVDNTTNVTDDNAGDGGHTVQAVGEGNVINNTAGKNVQNITNVNNTSNVQQMQHGGGNATSMAGGKNVQQVTHFNNTQTVTDVSTNLSENKSHK